jgi:Protein of unknown function (DUF1552)
MNRVDLNRRRFLKLVGASALTYPFLRGVPSFAAGNSGGTDPVYLVLLFTANGCIRYRWGAQGPAPTSLAPSATAVTNGPLQFRQTLSAFTKAGPAQVDLSKYVTVLDGLQNKAAGQGTHESGMSSLWTGLSSTTNGPVTGPSIDQAIASQLNAGTSYPSIAMVVQSSADYYQSRSVDNRMIYDLGGNWVDPIASTPAATVAQLFPAMATASSGPDKKTFIRQQVTNHINADLTSLQSRLCTQDRIQLQNLQGLWNTVLAQLAAAATQAAACTRPTADSTVDSGGGTSDPFPSYAQVMPNILAMTLACNLTQVASLQFSQALSPVTHHWLGPTQTDTHHNYSHQTPPYLGALFSSLEPLPALADIYTEVPNVASMYPQQLVDIETWYAQQVANLAYTFSQVSVGSNGKTLLDQSVVCWGSEIDMGALHNHDDTPFVLIGGGGGKLKCTQVGGQLVRFPLNIGGYSQNANQLGVRFHNDLLITLAQIMGVSSAQLQTAYGPTNWAAFNSLVTGPITDILA